MRAPMVVVALALAAGIGLAWVCRPGPVPLFLLLTAAGSAAILLRERGGSRFDERQWLWVHGADGILTVSDSEGMVRLRRALAHQARFLLEPEESGMLEAFRKTSTAHIVAPVSVAGKKPWNAFFQRDLLPPLSGGLSAKQPS